MSKVNDLAIYSTQDVIQTLAKFIDAGEHDNESLFAFVSELTGISEDGVSQVLYERQMLTPFFEQKTKEQISRKKLLGILQSYVSNDAESTELSYVQEMLNQAGCDKETSAQIGLGWVWPEE